MQTTIRQAKKGEFVQLKENGPVWVRGDYDRSSKTYCLTKFDDINREWFVLGSRKCFVGFDF